MIFEEKVKSALQELPNPEEDEIIEIPVVVKNKSMPILEKVKKVQSKVELSKKSSMAESKHQSSF